jgi:hypothetical protein
MEHLVQAAPVVQVVLLVLLVQAEVVGQVEPQVHLARAEVVEQVGLPALLVEKVEDYLK